MFEIYDDNGNKIGSGNDFKVKFSKETENQSLQNKAFTCDKLNSASFSLNNTKINNLGLGELIGLKIIENEFFTDKIQKRTHKKKRINKKWMKRYGFKSIPITFVKLRELR